VQIEWIVPHSIAHITDGDTTAAVTDTYCGICHERNEAGNGDGPCRHKAALHQAGLHWALGKVQEKLAYQGQDDYLFEIGFTPEQVAQILEDEAAWLDYDEDQAQRRAVRYGRG